MPSKPEQEFAVGSHSIGWLDSDFLPRLGHLPLTVRPLPTFQKFPRDMSDQEIESELKPGIFRDLGDLITFLRSRDY